MAQSDLVAIYRFGWGHTLNPIYPWKAYRWCRSRREPVPDWVLQYLDSAAHELLSLEIETPKRVASAVSRALKYTGGKGDDTAFKRYADEKVQLKTAIRVAEEVGDEHANLDSAYDNVAAELKIPRDTVVGHYKKFRTDISRPFKFDPGKP